MVISWQINNLGSKINIRTIIDSLALAAILQTVRKILHDFDINYIQICSPQHSLSTVGVCHGEGISQIIFQLFLHSEPPKHYSLYKKYINFENNQQTTKSMHRRAVQSKLFITSLVITEYLISDIKLLGMDLFLLKFPLYNRIIT